jgi:hypothetical protein
MSHNSEPRTDLFTDRPLAPMEDLHAELSRVAPGSAEEKAILARGRQRVEHQTDEFRIEKIPKLLEASSDRQIVGSDVARHVAHAAIEQVTDEHRIPVEVLHPDGPHQTA